MEHTNKRGWIKNVIIIFLVIMLILTLFSNTIMNRSLPEVSVSNSEGGQITSQVKLSGTVSANQTRQVVLEEARTVDTVAVRRGDTVQRGDVLATLVAGESADVYDLEIELRRLEIEYKQMLLAEDDSLVSHYRTIEDSQKALAKIDTYMQEYSLLAAAVQGCEDEIAVLENDIEAAEQHLDELQEMLDLLDEKIEDLQKQQKDYSAGGYSSQRAFEKEIERMEDAIEALEESVDEAKSARNTALAARTKAQEALDAYDAAIGGQSSLAEEIEELEEQISAKKQEKKTLEREYTELLASVTPENPLTAELAAKQAEIDAVDAEIDTLQDRLQGKKDALQDVNDSLGEMLTRAELEEALEAARATYNERNRSYNAAKDAVNDAEEELTEYSDDGFAYFLLQSRIEEYEKQKEPIQKESREKTKEKEKLAEQLADAEERLSEAEGEIDKTPEECEEERVRHNRAIEDAENAIELAKANGAIEDETAKLNLSIKKSEIDRKKKQIADLKAEISETEIKAPVGGTVASVSVTAGDETEAGDILFEITMNEMGYTMECSVTNSQASRLRVGQEAEVQYYYWGAKPSVRITQIVGDPNSGGKNKLVTFAVEGDVSEGTSLSLAIGTQGASYDTIVPNSAIREDANGQFILKVVAKSSPLGNRYYAERLNVEVLASDATKSAINASLSWGDYVITGASVPISEGMQVRMAEK